MFFDHFTSRGLKGWAVPKGDWRIQRGTWLVLTSGGPQRGSEVQSVQTFTFGSLLVRAKSGNWSHDTSIGFESFSGPYKGVVVKNGGLHISRAHQSHEIKIVDWNEVRKRENVFWLIWGEGCVELHIADHEHVYSHASHRVPHEPLRVRLNASNDCRDTLMVDYVAVLP